MKRVLSICLLGFVLFSCKPQTEVTEEETTSPVTTYLNSDEPTEEAPEVVVKEVRYWSSSETKLPKGIVYTMDCANKGKPEQKVKDNYVTIKRTNGFLTIVKDIDDDLFLNLQDGDVID
jgi:hypothetical protein